MSERTRETAKKKDPCGIGQLTVIWRAMLYSSAKAFCAMAIVTSHINRLQWARLPMAERVRSIPCHNNKDGALVEIGWRDGAPTEETAVDSRTVAVLMAESGASIPSCRVLLLDNQSTVDVFCDSRLMTNMCVAPATWCIRCYTGTVNARSVGEIHGYLQLWYFITRATSSTFCPWTSCHRVVEWNVAATA
mmetsp:Transcript_33681/g.49919  ORF Transcript_33681/g.49919 Transcript_33681/m.49919 type:complete len:191 (+) Transcript_33681:190-762(+)